MKDDDIWLRIKAAEIVATYFDSTDSVETFCHPANKVYKFIKSEG